MNFWLLWEKDNLKNSQISCTFEYGCIRVRAGMQAFSLFRFLHRSRPTTTFKLLRVQIICVYVATKFRLRFLWFSVCGKLFAPNLPFRSFFVLKPSTLSLSRSIKKSSAAQLVGRLIFYQDSSWGITFAALCIYRRVDG